jgi:ligand-binding sensor domain-containing protein
MDPATGRFTRYRHRPNDPAGLRSDTVLSLLEDGRGRLWVGTWNGLHVMEPGPGTFTAYRHDPADPSTLSGNTVTALFTDRAGGIWIGTDRGVNKVETNQKKFRRYFYSPKQYKNDNNRVTALCEDGAGGYWLGTKNYVVRLDRKSAPISTSTAATAAETWTCSPWPGTAGATCGSGWMAAFLRWTRPAGGL